MIWSNADRFALVNGIGGAFIFLGKIFISLATTFFCYLILSNQEPYKSEMSSYVLPCIVSNIPLSLLPPPLHITLSPDHPLHRVRDQHCLHDGVRHGYASDSHVLPLGREDVPDSSPASRAGSPPGILHRHGEEVKLIFIPSPFILTPQFKRICPSLPPPPPMCISKTVVAANKHQQQQQVEEKE